jgi:hypothetical protein
VRRPRRKTTRGIIIFKRIFIAAGAALAVIVPVSAGAQSIAPGQSKADYHAWLAQAPENRQDVNAFRSFLADRQVDGVIPVWQLIRTSSSWRQCNAQRFEVAPDRQWENIVGTLAFVKNEVRPAIGEVEALSVFRNAQLNGCSNGAPQSAHRMLFAVDLTPVGDMDRSVMISRLCSAHAQRGVQYSAGLGFYSGARFHVDSSGFRKWGADGRGASSPCNGRTA